MPAQELFRREAAALVDRLRLWTPARWAAAAPVLGTRADVVHHLAQALADAAADLEGHPRHRLPRPELDAVLADQLAVTAQDLRQAGPPHPVAVRATAHLLVHREDLLGDPAPAGLAQALGVSDVTAAGRVACAQGS